jgi:D-amino-acid oxidase
VGRAIRRRAFTDVAELLALDERVVLNCTGLGAHALVGDEAMLPIKGQLTALRPQQEVDYVSFRDDLYMFPRADGILLGGTYEGDVRDLAPSADAIERVLRGHVELFGSMPRVAGPRRWAASRAASATC